MKRLITVLLVVFMLALSVRVVLAGGDQVRGDGGGGDMIGSPTPVQTCASLYDDCPYGDYEPSVTPPAYE